MREYTGVFINFKTYSKSFKNKKRYQNPEENWVIFENHHEAIIDPDTWEIVQKLRTGCKLRKPQRTEKNINLQIISAWARHVLNNDRSYITSLNIFKHFLKTRTVKS